MEHIINKDNLEETYGNEYIKENITDANPSKTEEDFVNKVTNIDALKDALKDLSADKIHFFELLKRLDEILMGDRGIPGREPGKYGYLSDEEAKTILESLFIQRYVEAHAEDGKDEKKMNNALQDFISDKYDSGVHFFEEILQNIDDAIGRAKDSSENDKVEIEWIDEQITFSYPDRGFSFYDLMAITSLGNSIKKGDLEHASIGEKGIGFKSVFSVAKQVDIKSKYFSFGIKYDRERKTSVLQPDYIDLNGSGSARTELTLTFFDKFLIEDEADSKGFKTLLKEWLFDNKKEDYFNYSPFLFLKNVKEITYSDGRGNEENISIRNITMEEENLKKLRSETTEELNLEGLSLKTIAAAQYLVYKSSLKFNKELIEKRWGRQYVEGEKDEFTIDRPIEIAFPIVEDDSPTGKKGLFYSFLPTEMEIDNPIYINVDVHLKSSRGRISEKDFADGSEWNKYVRDNLETALKSAFRAVIETFRKVIENKDNDNEDLYEAVSVVAKKLYLYMYNEQTSSHYFMETLKEFFKDIKEEEVYLNCENEFVKKDKLWMPGISERSDENKKEEWNRFVNFCGNEPLPCEKDNSEKKMQYPFDLKWYDFARNNGVSKRANWQSDLIDLYGGIDRFYNECGNIDNNEKNEIVFWLLNGVSSYSPYYSNRYKWKIIFLKTDKEDGSNESEYIITSKSDFENENPGKVIFSRMTETDFEDDELICYVYEDVFEDGQKRQYLECLERILSIQQKNWTDFINNKLKNLKENEVEDIINDTYKYVLQLEIGEISKIENKEIKEKACKLVLPIEVAEPIMNIKPELFKEGKKKYLQKIATYFKDNGCQEYEGYRLLKVGKEGEKGVVDENIVTEETDENKKKLVKYLARLGCKLDPEIIVDTDDPHLYTYDKLTKAIIKGKLNYKEIFTDPKTLEFDFDEKDEEKELKKYLINFSRGEKKFNVTTVFDTLPKDKIIRVNPEIIKNGFDISINITGPKGGHLDNSVQHINSFGEKAAEDNLLFNDKKEKIVINCSELIFVDGSKYQWDNIAGFSEYSEIRKTEYDKGTRYDEKQIKMIETIINAKVLSENMLDKIRWLSIWNKVFSVQYAWRNETYEMKKEDFLSCYEYLGREDIDALFPKGYTVKDWGKDIGASLSDKVIEVKDFLSGEFENDKLSIICDNLEKFRSVEVVENDFEEDFLSLGERYEKLEKGTYEYLIFIHTGSNSPKTDYMRKILKTIGIELREEQQKELSDILGEVGDNKQKVIIELQNDRAEFSEAIFNDGNTDYEKIIEEAKEILPSVWKKDNNNFQEKSKWGMKRWLCEPYDTSEGEIFQGYGYQCPICGSSSKIHSLSGLKFLRRLKNSDPDTKEKLPYLPLIACLNCADMIEGAKKICIKDYDGTDIVKALKHFEETCYCADRLHISNKSKMKTMKLFLEIDEKEFCEEIKVSFLHLALFAKLLKKDKTLYAHAKRF